jgi:antitoxin component YwqK of YwqJK toxin-antitoxin module
MKITFLLINAILLAFCSYAQQTIRITNHLNHALTEHYDVLKSNNNIKEGNYTLMYENGRPSQVGYYRQNLKDSVWICYTPSGKVRNKGTYKDGAKTGIWEYYVNDTLENKYNFTIHELLYHRPQATDTADYYVIGSHDTTTMHLNRPPLFLGGQRDLAMQIGDQIIYAVGAIHSSQGMRVKLLYTIADDGKILNAHVLRPNSPLYDNAAIHCFNNVDGEWIPGLLNGKPVTTLQVIPINFNGTYHIR